MYIIYKTVRLHTDILGPFHTGWSRAKSCKIFPGCLIQQLLVVRRFGDEEEFPPFLDFPKKAPIMHKPVFLSI